MSDTNKDVQNSILEIIQKTLKDDSIEADNHFFKEGDFGEMLGVGRSTVRQAITSLEIRGYVKRVHGRGIKAIDHSVEALSNSISDMLMRSDFEYMDIIQFRNILEVKGAGLAARFRSDENLEKMASYIEIMNQDVTYKAYLDADFLFHEEIIKATQNKMLMALISAYSKLIRYAIEMSTDSDYRPELGQHYHARILETITAGDVAGSEKEMEAHLMASNENVDALKKEMSINW